MDKIRTIKVAGVGTAEAEANQAIFTVTVSALTLTSSESLDQVNRRVTALKEALGKAGLLPDEIRSNRLEIEPRWERHHDRRNFQGYEATHRMSVKVDNTREKLDPVYRAVFSPERDVQVEVHFILKDNEALRHRARQSAMEDAMKRAAIYAETAGLSLGKLISMEETEVNDRPINYYALENGLRAPDFEDSPGFDDISYTPGILNFSVTITAIFAAEEKPSAGKPAKEKSDPGSGRREK